MCQYCDQLLNNSFDQPPHKECRKKWLSTNKLILMLYQLVYGIYYIHISTRYVYVLLPNYNENNNNFNIHKKKSYNNLKKLLPFIIVTVVIITNFLKRVKLISSNT